MKARWSTTLCVFLVLSESTLYAEDFAVGREVIPKRPGVKFVVANPRDGAVAHEGTLFLESFQVVEVTSGRLRVHWYGSVSVWINKADAAAVSEAQGYFSNIIANNAADDYAYAARGAARVRAGIENGDKKLLQRAMEDCNEAIKHNDKRAETFYMRAMVWIALSEPDKAIGDLTLAVGLEPKRPWALNARGMEYIHKGDMDKAIRDFDAAAQIDPTDAEALENRSRAWIAKGEFWRAKRDLSAAIKLDPGFAPLFANRGYVCHRMGDQDEAIKDCDEAIRLDAEFGEAYFSRFFAWKAKRKYSKALKDIDEALRLDPGNIEAFKSKSWLLATCPDPDIRDGAKAMELANKARKMTEGDAPDLFMFLAAAYAEAGHFDEAVKWQRKVLAFDDKKDDEDEKDRLELYLKKKPHHEK